MLELVKAVSLSEVDPTQAQPAEAPKKSLSASRGSGVAGRGQMEWPSLDTLMGPGSEQSTQSSVEPLPSYSSQVVMQPPKRRPPPCVCLLHSSPWQHCACCILHGNSVLVAFFMATVCLLCCLSSPRWLKHCILFDS